MKRNWIIASAVAAMMATAVAGASAQTADTTTPSATTPMATSTDTGAMPMSGDMPDYSLLANPLFNYSELKSAKAKGLSDDQIASILRITKLTGAPFRDTVDKVLTGKTFPTLAYEDNLKLSDVLDADTEKQQIAAYLAAYETTGTMALKSSPNMDMSTSSSMNNTTSMSVPMMANKDIVETAMSERRFSTLVRLLKRANLVDTLKGPGPFTVFAPTDAAFRKLPKGTIQGLTNDQLTKILTYHVIPQKIDAATAMAMTSPTSPPTVEGSTLQVTTSDGTVMVNDAKVTQADIQASNGIIHAIDTVLMPPDLSTTPAAQ